MNPQLSSTAHKSWIDEALNAATVSALIAINRRFYERYAVEFDATRGRPWPGWQRIVERLPTRTESLSVLDVGCGNARLASFLHSSLAGCLDYLGLDASDGLLKAAAKRCRELPRCRFQAFELVTGKLDEATGGRRFDLVTAFGVLHHIPGSDRRAALIRDLGQCLQRHGRLAVSIWQLHRSPGFERKTVSWERYNQRRREHDGRSMAEIVDLGEIEAGDYLLAWNGRQDPPRYCHFPVTDEVESWVAASGLEIRDRFTADGPGGGGNLYLVLG